MARPLIREPNLPNKFRDGISESASCVSCNQCVVASDTRSIRCYYKKAKKKDSKTLYLMDCGSWVNKGHEIGVIS
jgi:formate hydrogenlyase subunit 6/NADH:ubiquinone oxidoreductase subunit I